MWWLAYLVVCCAMLAGLEDRRAIRCVTAFALGLVVMQVWKIADMGHWQWAASAATWVAVSVATQRHSVTFSTLTLFSAMCYAVGRVRGLEFAPMTAPIVFADIFGVAGLVLIGGRGIANLIRRMGRAVSRLIRGSIVVGYLCGCVSGAAGRLADR